MEIGDMEQQTFTGRKLSWGELAEELEATRQKAEGYQDVINQIIIGFAELFPNEGWKTGDHPELGDMTEEFANSVIYRVRRLVRETEETRRAAMVAIGLANLRSAHLRDFLKSEHMARAWYKAYNEYYVNRGQPTVPWDKLTPGHQNEIKSIAEIAWFYIDRETSAKAEGVDEISKGMLEEGDSLARALEQLAVFTTVSRAVWDNAVVPFIRSLSAAGINILPPGTIVHGVSTSPHRPE